MKYGAIYEMIDSKNNPSAILWCVVFFVRRITFTASIFFLDKYVTFQIITYFMATLAVMMIIGLVEPLQTKQENTVELLNNFDLLLITYSLFSFTDFVPDPDARYLMGYFLIFITVKQISINLLLIGISTFKSSQFWIKKKCAQRAAKKKLEEIVKMKQHKAFTKKSGTLVLEEQGQVAMHAIREIEDSLPQESS